MKTLFSKGNPIICFSDIVVNSDHLLCDDAVLPLSVIGDYEIVDGCLIGGSIVQKTREELKAERNAKVAAIVVTTSTGKAFNGDETSQTRMARAIVGMQAANATTIRWVLADNTDTEVTLAELSEALVLAGQAQAAIWILPD